MTGTLKKITFNVSPGTACGAYAGEAKINIQQKTNGNTYCSAPFPDFSEHDTGITFQWLGDCTNLDIDVGREWINFWIYADEHVCITSLKLEFSMESGKKVTFSKSIPGQYWKPGTYGVINRNVYSLQNQSRKFKIFSIEKKDGVYVVNVVWPWPQLLTQIQPIYYSGYYGVSYEYLNFFFVQPVFSALNFNS